MYNSKWIGVHGDTAYYLGEHRKVNKIDIMGRREEEVALCPAASDKKVVDFCLDNKGTVILLTKEGYMIRGDRVRALPSCKQYYHLLFSKRRLLCVG